MLHSVPMTQNAWVPMMYVNVSTWVCVYEMLIVEVVVGGGGGGGGEDVGGDGKVGSRVEWVCVEKEK